MKEQIDYLKQQGVYKRMLATGLISLKIDFYYDMNETYMKYRSDPSVSKMDAVMFTAIDCKVTEGTVYNAIKAMK